MVYYKNEVMSERKREKPKIFRGHTHVITEIRATRGRNAEHFIKVFRHESDNISGASLGVLLGVFEIDDQSEDSKYIVNFLFSVAKNEYFCNPRRGSMESFEAALHKINVALAEIVKHGNIDWLGKFHGTIAILEKNAIHLSATGDGRVYLFRNENLSHISEGLSSLDADEHPIKTFVEISSGRLIPNDRLLFVLPKIFTLMNEETLERQARRMDREHFTQFLRTAMINELEQGGALIVDIEEPLDLTQKQAKKPVKQKSGTKSYFSETAFETKSEESIAAALSEDSLKEPSLKSDYTDTKTGHIYIQGTKGAPPVESSRFAQYLEDCFHSSTAFKERGGFILRRYFRILSDRWKLFSLISSERLHHFFVVFFKKYFRIPRKSPKNTPSPFQPKISVAPEKSVPPETPIPSLRVSPSIPLQEPPSQLLLSFKTIRVYFIRGERLLSPYVTRLFQIITEATRYSIRGLRGVFSRMPTKIRISVIVAALTITGTSLWYMLSRNTPTSPIKEPLPNTIAVHPSSIQESEDHATSLPSIQAAFSHPETIAPTYLNGALIIVTASTIEIPSLNISASLPAASGIPRLITPMNDLHALFLFTDTGKLFSFTPSNQAFSENIFPIGTNIPSSISAYLTYLYTIDATGSVIMRFPRTQGGFGDGVSWLKQTVPSSQHSSLAVNDFLYVFSDHSLTQFSHGKEVHSFEMPHTNPEELLLAVEPDNSRVIGLDTNAQRIIVWNTDGTLLQQYFSDELSSATSVALHENIVAFSTPTGTFKIEISQ